ncbi:helix-turn-helix domain-containing protein [bacterium]|nr:helix-turn-helix domain-containing protein [bacterium]
MKKSSELPQAINNLRAIWEQKKIEMQFTQVEAAKELGWSQGAISHYLNNITALGPSAVIKFANFLGVDPLDIDPEVKGFLPNVRTRVIRYDCDNLSRTIDTKLYDRNPKSSFWVKTHPRAFKYLEKLIANIVLPINTDWHTNVCPVKDYPEARAFLIQLKGEKRAFVYRKDDLPPANQIAKKFAVLETEISNSIDN